MNHPSESLAMRRAKQAGFGVGFLSPWAVVGFLSYQVSELRVDVGAIRNAQSAMKLDLKATASATDSLATSVKVTTTDTQKATTEIGTRLAALIRCYDAAHRKDCGAP